MILKNLDLKKIFAFADAKAFRDLELFVEASHLRSLELRERITDYRQSSSRGLSAHALLGETERVFFTPFLDTDHILAALEGGSPPRTAVAAAATPPESNDAAPRAGKPHDGESRFAAIDAACRRLLHPHLTQLRSGLVRYEECERAFQVLDRARSATGADTEAHVRIEWAFHSAGASDVVFSKEFHAFRSETVLEWLARPELAIAIRRTIEPPPTWPVPRGSLATAWSPQAFARILLPIVRGFEADLVLSRRSWLQNAPESLPWRFSLEDRPSEGIDTEGTPRRSTLLFSDGKPRDVASDRARARRLGRPPSGHARRASHRALPTIGLWDVHVTPTETCTRPLEALGWGIFVDDAAILHSDPRNAAVWLRVHDAYLVHQGVLGERIEPFDLSIDLVSFLSKVRAISDTPVPIGSAIEKAHQSVLTTLTLGTAVLDPIEIPGTVPSGYYW